MKRIVFTVLWFLFFMASLSVIELIVLGFILNAYYHPIGVDAGVQAGIAFAKAHAVGLFASRVGILLVSFAGALVGSMRGALPGTGKVVE